MLYLLERETMKDGFLFERKPIKSIGIDGLLRQKSCPHSG